MRCTAIGKEYTVFGYKGKQVRDNIHCADLISAFAHFHQAPRPGEVYNIGGGRSSNASILEAICIAEQISQKHLKWTYRNENRHVVDY